MTPDEYRRIKPLFDQAMDTPPEKRSAFILKIRLADEELGRKLESLVESHTGSGAGGAGGETGTIDAPLFRFDRFFSSGSPSLAPGELLLDRFRIVRFIGRGGMGDVYEADDLQLGRVALKTIRGDLAGRPHALARFRQEVQLARKVTSTNVCRIHELFPVPAAGSHGAAAFLTMEFLEGETLSDRIERDGPLPYSEAEGIAQQLCAAVQAIHDAGVLHRDIKSRNVMLSPRNGAIEAVVMDLGLARESVTSPDQKTDLTIPGAVMGTPQYMAPEQFEGTRATPATDIYALGIVLYELITGEHPFQASTPMAAAVKRAKRPPSASSLRANLPPQWDEVINRCLEYEPAKRYQSATEVGEALQGRKPSHARRWAPYLAAALLLGVLIGGIARSPLLHRQSPSAGASVAQAKTMVVLPFENLGGGPANQALCDGLQETTTSMLSQAEKLRKSILVVPSSELRGNQVKTIGEARRIFNADLALTGSVQKSAESLQIALNLTDARSLRQRDSRILTVKPEEMAGLPQRLAGTIDSLLGAGSVLAPHETLPGLSTRDSEAYKLYLQGQGALQSHDWDKAVANLQEALAKDPEFAAARASLAEACVRKYHDTKDTQWLARADSALNGADGGQRSPEAMFAQAMIWQATGETDKAIALFRQLVEKEPNNVEAWDNLAETLKAAGKNSEAEETYQKAIQLRPGYWPAYNRMAAFYMSRQDYSRAEQEFLAGIRIAPGSASLHSNLGALYFTLSRWDDAAREFRASLAIKPYAPGYSNLGTVLFYQGKYADSARQFELAAKLQPANHVAWGNLGDARWQIPGQRDQARDAFRQAYQLASQQLVLNPKDVQLRKSRALYLAKLGRSEEARMEIEKTIQGAPKDMYVRFYAARVFAVAGDLKRAENEARASLALGYDLKEIETEPDLSGIHLAADAEARK